MHSANHGASLRSLSLSLTSDSGLNSALALPPVAFLLCFGMLRLARLSRLPTTVSPLNARIGSKALLSVLMIILPFGTPNKAVVSRHTHTHAVHSSDSPNDACESRLLPP